MPRAVPSPLGFYSAFLTAQGRVLFDTFIYPTSHSQTYRDTIPAKILEKYGVDDLGYLIEVDSSQADSLIKHLKRYKLRAKVDIRAIDEGAYDVWNVWDEAREPWTPHPSSLTSSLGASNASGVLGSNDLLGLVDSRAPGMGRRFILPAQDHSTSLLPDSISSSLSSDAVAAPSASYLVRRMLRGVPEGPLEIPFGAALPAEHNIDLMSGIDFRKGCYVGQELTIRTHHTGVIRKRILPVMLYSASSSASDTGSEGAESVTPSPLHGLMYNPQAQLVLPKSGSDIKPHNRTGRSAGKFVAGVGNIGLGLCRVEMMTDLQLTTESQSGFKPDDEFKVVQDGGETGEGEQVMVKAFVPEWMRGKIKVRKPQQRI